MENLPLALLNTIYGYVIVATKYGGSFIFFFVLYSTLLHLPPLRFHYADGCWDRTQDGCNWCIGGQTL
jgi:hypothetical protein